MKHLLVPIALLALAAPASAKDLPVAWQLTEGIKAPESAYFDAKSGFVFLSQIGEGGGKAKDGDGWISKLTADGKMVKNKWVTGLNAPKGLRSHGGKLWVTDIDELIGIDIAKGKISDRVKLDGAKFLNDLACGPDGAVYFSDMVSSRIYRYHERKLAIYDEGPELQHPNGLLVHGSKLIMAGWGKELQDDFSTEEPGQLLAIDLETDEFGPITPKPIGNLDGVESDGDGGFIVSDWRAGKVFHISVKGASKLILERPKGAADLAYLPDKKLLILPEMLENRVTAFKLR